MSHRQKQLKLKSIWCSQDSRILGGGRGHIDISMCSDGRILTISSTFNFFGSLNFILILPTPCPPPPNYPTALDKSTHRSSPNIGDGPPPPTHPPTHAYANEQQTSSQTVLFPLPLQLARVGPTSNEYILPTVTQSQREAARLL